MARAIKRPIFVEVFKLSCPAVLQTENGPLQCEAGDYLANDANKHTYRIPLNVFEKTYDIVDEDAEK